MNTIYTIGRWSLQRHADGRLYIYERCSDDVDRYVVDANGPAAPMGGDRADDATLASELRDAVISATGREILSAEAGREYEADAGTCPELRQCHACGDVVVDVTCWYPCEPHGRHMVGGSHKDCCV